MPEAQPLEPGDPADLGTYKILGRLGEGGQGVVFLGRAPHSEYVAIKFLHARLSNDSAARARFVRELDVAKQVARFCTAQVLDADVVGDQPYIVSEYVDGRSLDSLVKAEGPRTGGALERLAIGTLTALAAIHQAGIVHRDFKPHNVMLGPDGPRVIDFGVARALGATGDTQDIGTPAYMAPEQLTSAGPGPATDLFAWGATILFAATGRPPFGNDDIAAVMNRVLHHEPDTRPLPSPLREVVTACLAKAPEVRPTARDAQHRLLGIGAPHTADAFAAASSSLGLAELAEPPAQERPQATVPGPRKPGKWLRRPAPVAAGAVVGALLVGLPLWAATRNDGGGGGPAQQSGAAPLGAPGSSDSLAGKNTITPSASTGQAPTEAAERGGSSRPSSAGSVSATPTPRAPRPGDTPTTSRHNPYTATQVCDSGGHGGGYYVQRSSSFKGGATYQLYNSSGYNCVVTLKTANVGQKTTTWARLKRQRDGKSVTDSGSYAYYAGPVFLSAKGTCVAYAGGTGSGSTSASWANCG